jgi:SET and MYND domain-containing protein
MSWRDVEAHADFAAFRQRCQQQGARFPLLAARLACVKLAAAASLRPEGHRHTPSGSAQQDSALQGNVLNNDMDFLCYANLQPGAVPQEWQHQWALLRQGLLPAAAWLLSRAATQEQQQQQQIRNDTLTNTPKDADRLLQELGLDLDWYAAGVMARAHVNAFRVDTLVLPPYGGASGMDLAAAAAAMLSESEGPGSQDGSAAVPREGGGTGSAVYVVASLVNHSCEPNLDVIFPTNNSLLVSAVLDDGWMGGWMCRSNTLHIPECNVRPSTQHVYLPQAYICLWFAASMRMFLALLTGTACCS